MMSTTDAQPEYGETTPGSPRDEAQKRKFPVKAVKELFGKLKRVAYDDQRMADEPYYGSYDYDEVHPGCREWYLATRPLPVAEIGYKYPGCTNEQLEILRNAHKMNHPNARRWKPISSARAAKQFLADLKEPPNEEQKQCIVRLAATWNDEDWTPDVAIKSFFDLDKVYFGGYLSGKVRLMWKGSTKNLYEEMGEGHKGTYGITCFEHFAIRTGKPDVPVARICLNAQRCLLECDSEDEAVAETFGTLLHEMIHAYHMTRCLSSFGCDSEPHSINFHNCAVALRERTLYDIGLEVIWATMPGNKEGKLPPEPRRRPKWWRHVENMGDKVYGTILPYYL